MTRSGNTELEKIARLHHDIGGDTEFIAHLIALYRAQSDAFMNTQFDSLTGTQFADLAHRLAGATAQVGPESLLEKIQTVERIARSDGDAKAHLDEVLTELPVVVDSLENWVAVH